MLKACNDSLLKMEVEEGTVVCVHIGCCVLLQRFLAMELLLLALVSPTPNLGFIKVIVVGGEQRSAGRGLPTAPSVYRSHLICFHEGIGI